MESITRIYHYDYYSGPQIKILLDGVWVDDVMYLEVNLQQNKRPLYGYASTYFNAVASGTVLVSGTFSINFRADGYLSAIILGAGGTFGKETLGNTTSAEVLSDPTKYPNAAPIFLNNRDNFVDNGVIGKRRQTHKVDTGSEYQYRDLWTSDQINNMIKTVWGIDNSDNNISQARLLKPDNLPPFNIVIEYGDQGTVNEVIQNVHIVGTSKSLGADGNPVTENYAFIAQDFL